MLTDPEFLRGSVKKLGVGLYENQDFNFDLRISRNGGNLHQEDEWCDSIYTLFDGYCEAHNLNPKTPGVLGKFWADVPPKHFYGVCDSPEQFLTTPLGQQLRDDPNREFCVSFTCVRKADQPKRDGWRWHKWGEYIGNHRPQHEYLADEEGIEEVYCFHLYLKKTGDWAK